MATVVQFLSRARLRCWPSRDISIVAKKFRIEESNSIKRARLFYQSRKRGTLENGILLSSFTAKYLKDMDDQQLAQLDHLLNGIDSEWQLYYWITGREAAPPEFQYSVLKQLQTHCQQLTHSHNLQPRISPKDLFH